MAGAGTSTKRASKSIGLLLLFLFMVSPAASDTRIYVTIAGHIEDEPVYANCDAYPAFRSNLLHFAELMRTRGLTCNLQIDYEFLHGTHNCETEDMRAETGGTNLIHYLATYYGFEIDAHQEGGVEEGLDNYADVRYLGGLLTTNMSEGVGGLVWNDPPQFAHLANGENGWLYPHFKWFPEVLTLAVSQVHRSSDFSKDDIASGVWKPKGAGTNFWAHNPAERMIYVGPGENFSWGRVTPMMTTPEFVQYLADGLQAETIPTGRMYTATLTIPQSIIFNTNEHARLIAMLDAIEPCILSGQAEYVTYSEAVEIWENEYAGEPNIYHRPDVQPWYQTRCDSQGLIMDWYGIGERVYTIEETTNLFDSVWPAVPGYESITGQYDVITLTNYFGSEDIGIYRVRATTE